MGITVLLNRGGGAVAADQQIADKVEAALSQAGVDAHIELIDGGEYEVRCRTAAERGDALVIVGGGDGTISAAASVLAGTDTRLGILPLGTLNHFARDLGLPTDVVEAAKVIAAGVERQVDIGDMNGRTFINNSAIGLYPLMVVDRDTQRKRLGRSKRLAMLVASARTMLRFNHHRLTLQANDEKERIDTPLLFVGNNDYRLDLGGAGQRESLQDGKLFVLVMRKKTRRGLIAASIRALLNRARDDDMVRMEDVQRLRVSSSRSMLPVSFDGEVVEAKTPLEYRIRHNALRVIVPDGQ